MIGFNEGITFFNDDHGCWDMLKWAREGKIDVYCECVIKKCNDNMNKVVESDGVSREIEGEYSVYG